MNIGAFAVLFIVGIFYLWKGSIQISKKAEPWPKSKKAGRIMGLIFLVPFIIAIIIKPSDLGLGNQYKSLPIGQSYENIQHGFKITPPANWAVDESKKDGQIVGFIERSQDILSIVSVTSISDPEITSSFFDEYINNGILQARATPGVTFISSDKLTTIGVPAYLFELKMNVGNKLMHALQFSLLAKNGQVLIITGMSDDAQWASRKDSIRDSLMSFRLL